MVQVIASATAQAGPQFETTVPKRKVTMAFTLIDSVVRDLTRELALKFNTMAASPTERFLDERRVKYLMDKADDKKLVTFHWVQAEFDGKTVRMNGQHSSTALCRMNGAFPEGLKVHLDTFKVDTKEDLADLFLQYDNPNSVRSTLDASHSYQGLYDEVKDVDQKIAKLAIDGVKYYRGAVAKEPVPSGALVYQLFREPGLHGYIRWVGEVFQYQDRRTPASGCRCGNACHVHCERGGGQAVLGQGRAWWRRV
jgi:hypothetical protein